MKISFPIVKRAEISILMNYWRFPFPRRIRTQGFICGCGHSGTTLIATILASHPDAYVPLIETNLFFEDNAENHNRYLQLLGEAKRAGKRALIEKTPRHIRHLDLIRRNVRDARIVIPVRDGRDSVASMKKRFGELKRAMERWIADNSIVLAERGKPDVLIYRHEDLIDDPPRIVRRVCEFLRLKYDNSLLDFHRTERLWFGVKKLRSDAQPDSAHEAYRAWQVNQPIFDNRGRWRSELSESEIAELISGRGRPLMEAFGYL